MKEVGWLLLRLLVTNLSVYCFDKTTIDRLERDDDDG